MNGQYVYPPPPGVFFSPQNAPYFVPHAQYNPNPIQPNGAYPPYPYPYPLSYPGAHLHTHPYPPYVNPSANSHPDPRFASQVQQHQRQHNDSAPNPANAPQHPPGLPLPPSSHEKTMNENAEIHEYWRGRLAPLPGYRSKPILLPMRELKAADDIKAPEKQDGKDDTSSSLLPPMSFFAPGFQRAASKSTNIPAKPPKNKKKNKITEDDFQFDKYADIFVPEYLKKIQRETYPLQPLPALPVFPPPSYLQSFLIPRLIEEAKANATRALLVSPPIPTTSKAPILTLDTYRNHWTELLRWELDAITQNKEQIVLWNLGVKVAVWKDSEFVLDVPGIRENHPYLEVGDIVHMREVIKDGKRAALEGRVVALMRRKGLIYISSPPLKEHIQTFVQLTPTIRMEDGFAIFGPDDEIPFNFNISFMTSARALCNMDSAVTAVSKVLNSKDMGTNLARQWIFPKPDDYLKAPSKKMPEELKDKDWVDGGLNDEQRLAVTSVALYQLSVPHLISGPPGTGKTRTVVEAVLQIFRLQPEACILLCAPSNPATDTLAVRLQNHLLQHEMLRLNDPNRTFAEVPNSITSYCYVENNAFSIPPWKKLMQYRVIVCSCLDAGILVNAQCTNNMLMAMEEDVTAAIHPYKKVRHAVQPHWTHLLIDEAAQGSEPELLIPISAVLPKVYGEKVAGKTFMPQLTLCGDINQLGPLVSSDEARAAELEVSLLERLFDRPLYAKYSSLNSPINAKPGHSVSQRLPPYTHLVKNYRSHPAILMPPSAIFYNDSLEPCAKNGVVSWSGLPNRKLPLKFIGDESIEQSDDERASWYNPGQITAVVDVVRSLLADPRASKPPLRPGEIGIMAPWREQVWKLRERLRKEGFSAVDVGTVEDYQGRESRVIIISCVRSNPRFLDEDYKKGLGFVHERKRMNVAITRAKELMVIVGNGSILLRDPYWRSFLQFTIRNKLYEGPKLSLEMDGNHISRLESALILSRNGSSRLDAEEQGVVVAGEVARAVLRD